jgi:hypothetical protein
MSIKLSWPDINAAVADSIKVYRSTTPIDANSLPAPLATLAGTALEYEDTAVVRGTVYHYRVAAFKGSSMVISGNQIHGYFPNSGPGPQKLLRGDWQRGYFGRVPIADFLNAADAKTLCGLTVGSALSDTAMTHWYKFIIDGKILFTPNCAAANGVFWRNIYDAGLMYGTDDAGSAPATSLTASATNQRKIVTAKGFNFLVYSPKASLTVPTNTYLAANDVGGSDWFETVGRILLSPTRADAKPRWDDQTAHAVAAPGALSQHLYSTTLVYGLSSDSAAAQNGGVSNANYGWYPIFELQY